MHRGFAGPIMTSGCLAKKSSRRRRRRQRGRHTGGTDNIDGQNVL
jgi:hypothetical protein